MAILLAGLVMAAYLIVLGTLIVRHKRYHLIAGYNRAPERVKKQYDIEGLAAHVGNGLVTLGVLALLAAILLHFGLTIPFICIMAIFLLIAAIIPIGAPRFGPDRDVAHPLLLRVLPASMYESMKKGTRQWLVECGHCGYKRDLWDAGGIRWKAAGEPRQWSHCAVCTKWSWHKFRRKSESEKRELPGER